MGGGALGSQVSKSGSKEVRRIFTLAPWGEGVRRTGEGSKVKIAQLVRDDMSIQVSDNETKKLDCFASARNDSNRKIAFTLAEVLITLGVIGVVAALTLPSVVNNIKHKQLETAFKTAYSIFSQGFMNMKQEDGEGIKATYSTYDKDLKTYPKADEFKAKFYMYSQLKVIGKCNYEGITIRNYNNTADARAYAGLQVQPTKAAYDLLSNGMCSSVFINALQPMLYVDINGTKGPNLFGHDMFLFYVDSNDRLTSYKMSKLYTEEELKDVPNGMEGVAGAPCSIKSKQQGNGTGCTYYAIINQNPDDPTKGYWESLPR